MSESPGNEPEEYVLSRRELRAIWDTHQATARKERGDPNDVPTPKELEMGTPPTVGEQLANISSNYATLPEKFQKSDDGPLSARMHAPDHGAASVPGWNSGSSRAARDFTYPHGHPDATRSPSGAARDFTYPNGHPDAEGQQSGGYLTDAARPSRYQVPEETARQIVESLPPTTVAQPLDTSAIEKPREKGTDLPIWAKWIGWGFAALGACWVLYQLVSNLILLVL